MWKKKARAKKFQMQNSCKFKENTQILTEQRHCAARCKSGQDTCHKRCWKQKPKNRKIPMKRKRIRLKWGGSDINPKSIKNNLF